MPQATSQASSSRRTAALTESTTKGKVTDAIWYYRSPLGKNILCGMMLTISQSAQLSQKYTNHSVRVTAITVMKKANIEDRTVCAVSGHRNLKSLNSYDGRSDTVKREISARLDQAAAGLAVVKVNSAASEAQVGTSPQFFFQSSSSQIMKEMTQTTQAKPVFDLFAPNAAFEGCTFIFRGKGR